MGLFGTSEIPSKDINVIIHKCRSCKKLIGVYGTSYRNRELDELCNCDDPQWYSEIELKKIYKY